jgi:hypothetical protein
MLHGYHFKQTNMKEFLFVFRNDFTALPEATAEQMQEMTKRWMDWISNIEQKDRLVSRGERLHTSGKVLKAAMVTNGPYTEIKESIGGYSIVRAESYDEAVELAKGCPVLAAGGNVEVREIKPL